MLARCSHTTLLAFAPRALRTVAYMCVLVIASVSGLAGAQVWLPAAGAPWEPGSGARTGHGWFAAQAGPQDDAPLGLANIGPQFALLHLPPRAEVRTSTSLASGAGTLRVAARLGALPEALAAWENDVWLIFPPETIAPKGEKPGTPSRAGADENESVGTMRRVSRLSLVAAPLAGEFVTRSGLEARASLRERGDLLAATGSAIGPLVLLLDPQSGRPAMHVLRGSEWRAVRLPEGLSRFAATAGGSGGGAGMASRPGWIAMAATRAGPVVMWQPVQGTLSWALGTLGVESEGGITAYWKVQTCDAGPLAQIDAPSAPPPLGAPVLNIPVERRLVWADGQLVLAEVREEKLALFSIRSEGAVKLAAMDTSAASALVPLDGLQRAALVAVRDVAPAAGARGPHAGTSPNAAAKAGLSRFHVSEISLATGRTLFAGSGTGKLFAPWHLQVVMLAVSALVVAVLLFVLRSEGDTSLPLPPGLALAPVGRRFAAAAVDLALPALVAALIHGESPMTILLLPFSGRAPAEWLPLGTLTAVLLITCIAQEWATSRTLGKRLMGLGVIAYRQRPAGAPQDAAIGQPAQRSPLLIGQYLIGPPSLAQATARNLIRWLAFPATVLLLMDSSRRHPGDVLAKTVVACRVEDLQGDDDSDE